MKKRIVYAILVMLWMIFIYNFSAQTGIESANTSDVITCKIVETFNNYFSIKLVEESVSFFVRKFAHFLIYFLGGILIFNFWNTFNLKFKYIIILSVIFGVAYAISDEIHQYFIDGRAAQIRDVLIDSLGLVMGIIFKNILLNDFKEEKWKS